MRAPTARSVLTHGLCALAYPIAERVTLWLLGRHELDPSYRRSNHR